MSLLNQDATISQLQSEVSRINILNGWRSSPPAPGGETDRDIAQLSLIMTEVSEAIEEIRDGHSVTETYYKGDSAKPEGVPSELADVVIRALDFADSRGIDLAAIIIEKLAYNETRGLRHGGKLL